MQRAISRRLLITGTLGLALALAPACRSDGSNHEKWVNNANTRYTDMRSALMLDMAQQQFDTGDLDLAENTLEDAMSLDADNAKLHVLAGRIALERGRLERAYHYFNAAIEFDKSNADARYYQGLVMQRWQKYEQAQQRYREAYDIQPDNVAYLLATAEMMVERGRIDEALALLEKKLTYFDTSAAVRLAVGHLHVMKGRPDAAIAFFKQASLLDPGNLKTRENLALAQLAAGQTREAISTFEDLLRRDSMDQRDGLKRTLAQAYLEVGQDDRARALYLELARGPRAKAADWVRLGELSMRAGDLPGTLRAASRAIDKAPQRHEGYMLAGIAFQKQGKLDDALRMFDRATELAPTNASPLILRGISLERAGRRAAAAEAYRGALDRKPGDARVQKLLANVQ